MDEPLHPVRLEVQLPVGYERAQLIVRLLFACALGAIHQSLGGIFGVLYLLLPLAAAILISQHTPKGYVQRDGPWLITSLEWVLGLYAYMSFVTDRFPLRPSERPLRLVAQPHGEPSLIDALSRLVTSLPHAAFLFLFSILSALISLLMACSVLFYKNVPDALRSVQLRLLAWTARVLVYHASLSNLYPPFSMAEQRTLPPSAPDTPAHGNA